MPQKYIYLLVGAVAGYVISLRGKPMMAMIPTITRTTATS